MVKTLVVYFLFLFVLFASKPIEEGKIIYSGVDTLNCDTWSCYFDFILQRPCTSEADFNSSEFVEHIQFDWNGTYVLYIWDVNYVCFKDYGKINLDSINAAPPDSELVSENGGGLFRPFNVTDDSLQSLVGTSYVIKTRNDPRYTHPFYAKLRIINFDIKDSVNHIVEMIFVWAVQTSGAKEIPTNNLDTFDIPVPIISDSKKNSLLSSNHIKSQMVFKTASNRFVIPEELVGRVNSVEVYDLRGRLLKEISIKNEQYFVDLKGMINNKNILIVNLRKIQR